MDVEPKHQNANSNSQPFLTPDKDEADEGRQKREEHIHKGNSISGGDRP